jgi:hypothetical protein
MSSLLHISLLTPERCVAFIFLVPPPISYRGWECRIFEAYVPSCPYTGLGLYQIFVKRRRDSLLFVYFLYADVTVLAGLLRLLLHCSSTNNPTVRMFICILGMCPCVATKVIN